MSRCTGRAGVAQSKRTAMSPSCSVFGNSVRNSLPSHVHKELGEYEIGCPRLAKNSFLINRVGLGQFSAPPTALSADLGACWERSAEASSLETEVLRSSCHSSTRRWGFENCPIRGAAWAGRWGDAPLWLRFHSRRLG